MFDGTEPSEAELESLSDAVRDGMRMWRDLSASLKTHENAFAVPWRHLIHNWSVGFDVFLPELCERSRKFIQES